MCGICGAVSTDARTVDSEPVRAMLRAMVHRGPDAEGLIEAPGIAAGVRRLAVIDPEGGDQPIHSEDGLVSVVFNGEIYNHRELMQQLERRGHTLRTRADTEVLVHLWEERGPDMLDALNGMFAFCIHDRRTKETFIARDRLGIKPLYWFRSGALVAFASEIGVLLRHRAAPAGVDAGALAELFLLQFDTGERTVYEGIHKLLPGHTMHVKGGRLELRRWYELPRGAAHGSAAADSRDSGVERAARLRELLESAVALRTIADVPLGMFLSGGIDSSVIAAILSRHASAPVRTFSVGFEGPAVYDERRWARLAARHFGTEHHELVVSAVTVAERLPELIEHVAEPIVDPATIPTWVLSEFARREVTVALTGEGADELFAGYRRYALAERLSWLGKIPGFSTIANPSVASRMPGRAGQALEALGARDAASRHLAWSAIVARSRAARLFAAPALDRVLARARRNYEEHVRGADSELQGRLRADLCEWLPHDLLAKVDRASMAFSLEARVPFLDHRVVEWALALPDEARLRGRVTKAVLRDAFRDELPAEILDRPKRGFDLPLDDWIRGPLRELARQAFSPGATARWPGLDGDAARRMLREHLDGRRDDGLALFNLLSILLFLEGRG